MRIARLDLLRYGRFTDQSLSLPASSRDFHLIVGPNEAGKSTVRSAILDALFGIENRSPFNFIHAYSDMRLGLRVEHEDGALDFVRIKGRARTLQNLAGETLPETALAAILGTTERSFFAKMFGLDHAALLKGGREILDASSDVGQILFQSAAGIGSLGQVRDALEAEANGLWAKRRSSDREYYQASDDLERAEADLKQVTVRTRDWLAAQRGVQELQDSLDTARAQYRELEQQRARLDRLRRVAPHLRTLERTERDLLALGEIILLPPDAAGLLDRAERAIAVATQAREIHAARMKDLEKQIGALHPDEAVLARRGDIDALTEQRQSLRKHRNDIEKRREELKTLEKTAAGLARELGWPAGDEDALERRIPSKLVRTAMNARIREHDALVQNLAAARNTHADKRAELSAIEAELDALPAGEAPAELGQALAAGRALGDVVAQESRLATTLARARDELDESIRRLGPWQRAPDALRRLVLPMEEDTRRVQQAQAELDTTLSALDEHIGQLTDEIAQLELEITQFVATHRPVSLGQVDDARTRRDGLWARIRAGAVAPAVAAAEYEAEVVAADRLADQRHDKAQEASALQARLDRKEQLRLQLAHRQARRDAAQTARKALADDWAACMSALGLTGLPPAGVDGWRTARDRVLDAADRLADAQADFDDLRAVAHETRLALVDALGEPDASLPLASLVQRAADRIEAATRVRQQRATLLSQQERTTALFAEHGNRVAQAAAALEAWRSDWSGHLAALHLPADADPRIAEAALTLIADLDANLRQMRELRTTRIDAMQRDLDDFERTAQALAQELSPEIVAETPERVALALAQRLGYARDTDNEARQLRLELEHVGAHARDAASRIEAAQAELAPLRHLARARDNDALRRAVERSDAARSLGEAIRHALQELEQAGDGLPRAQLAAELAVCDPLQAAGELAALKQRVDEVLERQHRLSVDLNAAQEALARIAGQDAAAQAEARRQEALARMANAAERYVKVYTAARLLRWAIERFRETRQGPMLQRAGEIFSGLTLASFERLAVDYESDPPALFGRRASGEHVGMDGLSEGTRDQLYLALRLAALELHLQQAPAMPFIADDLFINYDDRRSAAGLAALAALSEKTQVIFLTHHEHLIPVVGSVFGAGVNIVRLEARKQRADRG